jgi:hypothetical protein
LGPNFKCSTVPEVFAGFAGFGRETGLRGRAESPLGLAGESSATTQVNASWREAAKQNCLSGPSCLGCARPARPIVRPPPPLSLQQNAGTRS